MPQDDYTTPLLANIEANAVGLSTPVRFTTIASGPERQSWPDGFTFSTDGYLYVTVNQLDRTVAVSGSETGSGTYLLMRFKPLAEGTVGR